MSSVRVCTALRGRVSRDLVRIEPYKVRMFAASKWKNYAPVLQLLLLPGPFVKARVVEDGRGVAAGSSRAVVYR